MNLRDRSLVTIAALCGLALCCGMAYVGGTSFLAGRYTACVPGRPGSITASELAGRYVSAAHGQLTLDASGTLTAQSITIHFDNRLLTLAGPGRWSLLAHDYGFGDISLYFDQMSFATYMEISGARSKPWLYWYLGDPDSCIIQRFDRT